MCAIHNGRLPVLEYCAKFVRSKTLDALSLLRANVNSSNLIICRSMLPNDESNNSERQACKAKCLVNTCINMLYMSSVYDTFTGSCTAPFDTINAALYTNNAVTISCRNCSDNVFYVR